jgi:methylamine--corrinoid protein Co-methyltransferase
MREPKADYDYFLSVLDRAENGQETDESDWDRKYIHKTIEELVRKYDISLHSEEPGVPYDDALADRVFEAGMELARESGVYCTDTHRRMIWNQNELDRVLAEAPTEVVLGEGSEEVRIRHRAPDQESRVVIGGGSWGVVVPEDLFLPLTVAYVQEELTDFYCTASLKTTYGRPIRAGSPWDAVACWQEMRLTLQALDHVGRPGMAVCAPNTTASAIGVLTTVTHGCIRRTDYNNNSFTSELKVSYEDLLRASHFVHTGSISHDFYCPIYGGYAGGPEGVAVAAVSGTVLQRACLLGEAFHPSPRHAHLGCSTFPALIPAQAVAIQALSRNTSLAVASFSSPVAGPGNKDLLYEIAAIQLAAVPSGVEIATGVQTATGRFESYCSPLEVRFMAQVAHAGEKLRRRDADAFVKRLIAKYKDRQGEIRVGRPFNEVYDLDTLKPTAEWQATYEQVCEELAAMGIPLA